MLIQEFHSLLERGWQSAFPGPRSQKRATKVADPVCGMELAPAEVAARLSVEGNEQAFCSETCLRKFVQARERYEA